MPHHPSVRATASALLLVALVAACSAGPAGPVDEAAPAPQASEASAPGTEGIPRGPIDDLLVDVLGHDSAEARDENTRRIEEATARCMAQEGFSYAPVQPVLPPPEAAPGGSMHPGSVAYAEQYGYGISVWPDHTAVGDGGEPAVDPNAAAFEAMTDSAKAAYLGALWGPTGVEGCMPRAMAEADGPPTTEFDGLRAEIDEMRAAVAQDPRVAALDGRWAVCMEDAGYAGYTDPASAETAFAARAEALTEEVFGGPSAQQTSTAEELAALAELADERLVAELAPEEVATAVADATCREEVDYLRARAEVDVEHQERFYADHEAEVEAWRAAAAGS